LLEQVRQGRQRAVGRLISLVENGLVENGLVENGLVENGLVEGSLVENARPELRAVMAGLAADTGRAAVIGLTGPPGVGKSTVTSALIGRFRALGRRVGVLAVDPSSPFSGGALLGDRIRMHAHATDREVFIRSMATRGHLGGLAFATPQALRVLDAAGCDVVLIETVGVGQSEVEVVALADTTVVLLAPGAGDGVQAAKAGVLEIGDVFVVNKADVPGAAATAREVRQMLAARAQSGGWRPPVLTAVASAGTGIDALVDAVDAHRAWLVSVDGAGGLHSRRRRRAEAEIEAIVRAELRGRAGYLRPGRRLSDLAEEVARGRTDPYTAADDLLAALAVAASRTGTKVKPC
jgi:LAO/AO transport system kinase